MIQYEYKVIDKVDLQSLNHWGTEGWQVVDRYYGQALLMRAIQTDS